jgi:hypothetical protein
VWRDINPNTTSYFRSKGEEVMAVTATEVQNDISGLRLGKVSHKRESIFKEPLRVTVLLRRSR